LALPPAFQAKRSETIDTVQCVYFQPNENEVLVFFVVRGALPFSYSDIHRNLSLPDILSSSQFPFLLDNTTGNITGTAPAVLTDLTAFAISCFSFANSSDVVGNVQAFFNPHTREYSLLVGFQDTVGNGISVR
jgi:hypothetical protein